MGYCNNKTKYSNIAQFEMLGRITEGRNVTAYVLKDRFTEKKHIFDKNETEDLVAKNAVLDVKIQIYKGKANLRADGFKISELPVYDNSGNIAETDNKNNIRPFLKIIGKMVEDRKVICYIVYNIDATEESKKKLKMSKDKAVEAARLGYFTNAKTQNCNGNIVIRGIGEDLSKLPNYIDLAKVEGYIYQ